VAWDQIFAHYPYPRWEAARRFGSELLVVDEPAVADLARRGVRLDVPFDTLERVFARGAYSVYRLDGNAGG
jgi:hypothetical protein